jgi:ribonuclease T2
MSQLRNFLTACFGAAAALMIAVLPAVAQREPYGGFPRGPSPSTAPSTKNEAGQFDYYLLALSWSPSYCASLTRDGYDPQCHRRDGKRYAFVLHGLWPQYNRGWPQNCPSADRGFVPRPVAERMLDIMPSEKLVFHEYRKHGVCSGLGINGYFDLARKLYDKVKIPQKFQQASDPRMFVDTDDVVKEFLAINPAMKPDSIVVECGGPGPRLKEVRVCFDKAGDFRSCGRNEDQKKLCSAPRIFMPPVREGGAGGTTSPAPAQPGFRPQTPLLIPGDRKI